MDYARESLKLHAQLQGKIEIVSRAPVTNEEALSLAYTPGVAQPCLEIQKDPAKSFALTRRWNTVAVVTDGTAVLGLGDIGPEAAMPVMEGKCVLFKEFGGVDAIPLCIRSKDVDEIVRTVELLQGSFGGINLEDIAAPRCFEIERRLKEVCSIPVFHDDQHGTAVVTLAALINAMQVVGKRLEDCVVTISGAGAAGVAIARLLQHIGVKDILMCDRGGLLCRGEEQAPDKAAVAAFTNRENRTGLLQDALRSADVLIGVSAPGVVTPEMVRGMNVGAVVLAMANPVPEIMPALAKAAGAAVIGTGRSDFPNQINNVLAFPGIFRGALDVRARDITQAMKIAAAQALASLVAPEELCADYILPKAFDPRLGKTVAAAVARAALEG
ncbi:MAG: NADP-dependent malic enzyme [Oscillospiraceae bacterium]|jgi:malate dehydrogenase (oxaloacetate-decarboxylating)|nr:NADP-dependent malic enzyme [Oscillospiraceae bacterium]